MTPASTKFSQSSTASKSTARTLAIETTATHITAVSVVRSGGRLTIAALIEGELTSVGERAASAHELLEANGLATQGAVVALSREGSLLGTVELPTIDEADLRSMARMAIARDYTPEGIESVGDFQIASRNANGAVALVAAVARTVLENGCARAGTLVARASLRTLGTIALIRASDTLRRGITLVVDCSRDSVDFTVARDGVLVHSRSTGVTSESMEARATAVLAEFRRLAVALRGAPEPVNFDRVVVCAERALSARLTPELSRLASCAATRLESHPSIDASNPACREQFLASAWPLAGLLLEDEGATSGNGSAIDLLHPTQLIDVAARRRQRALVIAGVCLVASLAGWTLGARSWRDLETRRDDLKDKARNALPELRASKRDELRLKHIDAYATLAPSWLAHFDTLRRFAPDPTVVVLDGMTAQLVSTDVEYSSDGKFITRPELRFVIDGEAKDRAFADALRDTLVKEKGYTLGSTGADARGGRRLAAPFAYTLRTADLAPRQPAAASEKDSSKDASKDRSKAATNATSTDSTSSEARP